MELLLVRHGRPVREASEGGGPADPRLSDEGLREASLLAEHLAGGAVPTPEVVWSSPMRRARETAERIGSRIAVPTWVDDRLAEFDVGATDYVPMEEVAAQDHAELWRALETGRWGAHRFDPQAFQRRVREAVDDIVAARESAVVAVVCHSGVVNSYLSAVLERPNSMFCRLAYTSVTRVLASRAGHRQLVSLNETPHLQAAHAR